MFTLPSISSYSYLRMILELFVYTNATRPIEPRIMLQRSAVNYREPNLAETV